MPPIASPLPGLPGEPRAEGLKAGAEFDLQLLGSVASGGMAAKRESQVLQGDMVWGTPEEREGPLGEILPFPVRAGCSGIPAPSHHGQLMGTGDRWRLPRSSACPTANDGPRLQMHNGRGGEVGDDPLSGLPKACSAVGVKRPSALGNPASSAGSPASKACGSTPSVGSLPPSPSVFVPHLMYSSGRLAGNKGGSLGNQGLLRPLLSGTCHEPQGPPCAGIQGGLCRSGPPPAVAAHAHTRTRQAGGSLLGRRLCGGFPARKPGNPCAHVGPESGQRGPRGVPSPGAHLHKPSWAGLSRDPVSYPRPPLPPARP